MVFAIHSHESAMGVHGFPIQTLPPHPIPQGHPSAPALSTLSHFKPTFSFSFFTFIKRLFSSSLLSDVRVVSSAYLRLLIFLPAILIPTCALSSPVFPMMYSAYKLNKQGENIQPWLTPFPIWNPVRCSTSSSNCCFLPCIQVSQEAGHVVWYTHLFKDFPHFVVIHIKSLA